MRKLILSVLGLVALFHLAGGWYFSEQLRRDAIEPDHEPAVDDVTVVEVGAGTIRLSAIPGTDPELMAAGILGLDWGTGYGQLSTGFESHQDQTVTRNLSRISGEQPPIGGRARLDANAFPSDPDSAFGLDYTDVTYTSPLGAMNAWRILATGDTWVIHVHGLGVTRAEALRLVGPLAISGYPQLVISYRNDEGQPADESGYFRFGITEWEDLAGAVNFAVDQGAAGVVLVGYSTGAAHIMSYLKHVPDNPVRALVFDSPNLDFEQTVDLGASQESLPLGLPLPPTLVWTAKRLASIRFGLDWDAINYLPDSANLTVPALVVHGTADDTVPYTSSEAFARSRPELVRLLLVPGAGHVRSWNVGPQPYERAVSDFLSEVLSE